MAAIAIGLPEAIVPPRSEEPFSGSIIIAGDASIQLCGRMGTKIAILSGHYLDILTKAIANEVDTQDAQPPEKAGAVGGNRTHMGAGPGGF
jgi:hypothetical protein